MAVESADRFRCEARDTREAVSWYLETFEEHIDEGVKFCVLVTSAFGQQDVFAVEVCVDRSSPREDDWESHFDVSRVDPSERRARVLLAA